MAAATMGDYGFGMGIGGAIKKSIASVIEANTMQGWYNTNAILSESESQIASIGAKMNIKKFREQADAFLSGQVALYAKAGVKLEGSPIEVLKASARELEYDALVQEYNADVGMWGANLQASMYRGYGASAARAGVVSGVASGVSNMSTLLMMRG